MGCTSSGSVPPQQNGDKATTLPEITPEMKKTIRESWDMFLEAKNERGQTYGFLIFVRLFELQPSSLEIFNFISDPSETALYENKKLERHVGRIAGKLTTVIQNLDQLDVVAGMLKSLGKNHIAYGATTAYLVGVAEGLTFALETALKDEYTADVAKAWTVLLAYVYHFMSEGLNSGGVNNED